MLKILTPDFVFGDERGTLVQLLHDRCSQVNIVTSVAGAFRGGHYHKINTEIFYVISGEMNVTVSRDGKEESYAFTQGDMFEIEPYVIHSFDYTKDSMLAVMYDKGVVLEDGSKDIYT